MKYAHALNSRCTLCTCSPPMPGKNSDMLKSTRDGLPVGQRWPRVGSRCNRYPLHSTAIGRRLQNREAAGVTARISPREKYSHRNIFGSENISFLGETCPNPNPKPNPNPNPNPDPNPNRSRKKFSGRWPEYFFQPKYS